MKLICPDCRRENEQERIYCHDCGARLDRSPLAKIKDGPKDEDPKETQRRLKSMIDPQGAKVRRQFFQGSKLLLGAMALAALVQMIRTPDLPERLKSGEMPTPINLDLETLSTDTAGGVLRYSDEQVNDYLAYALRSKPALNKYLKFERAIVAFGEGSCEVTAVRSLLGLPLSTSAFMKPRLENGELVVSSQGGRIGRLPVHPSLKDLTKVLFADVRAALDRERKSIVKLGGMELYPKQIVFTAKQP